VLIVSCILKILRIKKLWKDLHFRSMMLLSHQLIIASHSLNFQTCIFFLFLWYKVSLTFWLYFFSFSSQVKNSWNVYSNLIVLESLIDISFINLKEYEEDGINWTKVDFEDNQECLNLFEKVFQLLLVSMSFMCTYRFLLGVCGTRMFALHLKWSLFNYFGCFRNL
jgi:hypothetical protein